VLGLLSVDKRPTRNCWLTSYRSLGRLAPFAISEHQSKTARTVFSNKHKISIVLEADRFVAYSCSTRSQPLRQLHSHLLSGPGFAPLASLSFDQQYFLTIELTNLTGTTFNSWLIQTGELHRVVKCTYLPTETKVSSDDFYHLVCYVKNTYQADLLRVVDMKAGTELFDLDEVAANLNVASHDKWFVLNQHIYIFDIHYITAQCIDYSPPNKDKKQINQFRVNTAVLSADVLAGGVQAAPPALLAPLQRNAPTGDITVISHLVQTDKLDRRHLTIHLQLVDLTKPWNVLAQGSWEIVCSDDTIRYYYLCFDTVFLGRCVLVYVNYLDRRNDDTNPFGDRPGTTRSLLWDPISNWSIMSKPVLEFVSKIASDATL